MTEENVENNVGERSGLFESTDDVHDDLSDIWPETCEGVHDPQNLPVEFVSNVWPDSDDMTHGNAAANVAEISDDMLGV